MILGAFPALSLRSRLALLIVIPLLVALPHASRALGDAARSADASANDARALQEALHQLLLRAQAVSDHALARDAHQAHAAAANGPWRGRLEGVGVLGPDLTYVDWAGTPAEPSAGICRPDWPRATIRVEGVRTRLLVRSDADADGRIALTTMVIDSTLDDLRFTRLVPRELRQHHDVRVEFIDTEAHYGEALGTGARRDERADLLARTGDEPEPVLLFAPDGATVLAVARLTPLLAEHRRARDLDLARALATLAFVATGLLLFGHAALDQRPRARWVAVSGGVVLVRGLVAWARVPALLLPRELGSPSLFAAWAPLDLLASPADLALSAGALYLLAAATRAYLSGLARRRAALLAATLAALGTALALELTLVVVRNARMSALVSPLALAPSAPLLMIWLGPVLALLAAAEGVAALVGCLRGRPASRRMVAWAFLPLAGVASLMLEARLDRLVLERLSSEYAPLVLEQAANRRVALQVALGEVQAFYQREGAPPEVLGLRPSLLAYRFWSSGELFHGGYRSSLDFLGAGGARVSHFGFDLPELDDTIELPLDATREIRFRDEEFLPLSGLAVRQKLLHAEAPVVRAGELLGLVVGHIVDEPDNLPFLPGSRPYLAAMGPDPPGMLAEGLPEGPEYVLYDAKGLVVLSTLLQPPARAEIDSPNDLSRGVRVTAGAQPYRGLALPDQSRLHLLLVPERGTFERLATAVRLALVGLALLGAHHLAARLLRPGGARRLVQELRGSLYNKLLLAVLLASVPPLLALALFLQGYLGRRADAFVIERATQYVSSAQRVIEDYSSLQLDTDRAQIDFNDSILHWLRRVIGQEIHLYDGGVLKASSKRELFASGLLPERLAGGVERQLAAGLPYFVAPTTMGPDSVPVAYAPIRLEGPATTARVLAIPLVLEQRQVERQVSRIGEMILLATVALLVLLALVAAQLARTVSRPVRELAVATGRISAGDYETRLVPRTHDEVAGLVVGFNAMASALSRQRADLEEQRDYMETLLRHDTTGVISLDPRGRIVTLNPAAGMLLGSRGAAPAIGTDLAGTLEANPSFRPLAGVLRAPAAQPADVDLVFDAERRRLRVVRVELRKASGEEVGTLILLDDVTDLMRSNQLAAWAEMARVIAHEIKNPLTPIQLSSDHLRRLLADRQVAVEPAVEACLDTIAKQVRALYEIAGEFSTYAKLPALDPQPTDAVALVRDVVAPYRLSGGRGLVVEEDYGPAPPIAVDRRVLSRALVNLVENAVQALSEGGTLRVGVAHDPARDEVVLSVGDTGPGLAPELRARLFEPYFSTKSGGTGLGLAIVRRAVEAHAGRIEVTSDPGRGTEFRLHVPVHRAG